MNHNQIYYLGQSMVYFMRFLLDKFLLTFTQYIKQVPLVDCPCSFGQHPYRWTNSSHLATRMTPSSKRLSHCQWRVPKNHRLQRGMQREEIRNLRPRRPPSPLRRKHVPKRLANRFFSPTKHACSMHVLDMLLDTTLNVQIHVSQQHRSKFWKDTPIRRDQPTEARKMMQSKHFAELM